jgi:uncharacterized protein
VRYVDIGEPDMPFAEVGTPTWDGLPLQQYLSLLDLLNPMHRLWSDGRWNKLTVAHGCYWKKCSFCDVSLDYISRYDAATAETLADRIEAIVAETGQTGFHFVDEAAPPKSLKALAAELQRAAAGVISWWGNIRFEKSFTPELCRAAGRQRLHRHLRRAGGGLRPAAELMKKGVSVEQVARVTKAFSRRRHPGARLPDVRLPDADGAGHGGRAGVRAPALRGRLHPVGFFHRFACTVHSPVGRHPEQYGVTLLPLPEGASRATTSASSTPPAPTTTRWALALKKALYNYMHGIGLERRTCGSWFASSCRTARACRWTATATASPARRSGAGAECRHGHPGQPPPAGAAPMHILMTGATGLIGRELGKALVARGDSVVALVRDVDAARRRLPFPAVCHAWDHRRAVPAEALRGVDAVIHLAGEPVADTRWSAAKKAAIRDTRVLGTRRLVQAVLAHGESVGVFVHGSASGVYGDRGDEVLSASSPPGAGFLADVVKAWEAELRPLAGQRPALRVPVLRTGIVLALEGGALAEMLPMFRLSAAGRLGSGRQWMGWIHLDDIVRLFLHALDRAASGVLEGVAPKPVSNREFTAAVCGALDVIENLPVPSWAVRALFGERAEIVLGSARLQPATTLASGFVFRFETLDAALDELLQPLRGGVRQRCWEQWLPHGAEELWPFFCDARNLEDITPPFLHFEVLGMSTPEIGAGTLIDYRLALNGIPIRWRTRIDVWEPPRRFVDLQERGPYALWHHTHDFVPLGTGTLMRDTVRYRLPFGWPGALAGGCKVDADVQRIFDYRSRRIDERFAAAARAGAA